MREQSYAAELVGAYRLGMVDKLIAEHGLDQIASSFNYNQEFIDKFR